MKLRIHPTANGYWRRLGLFFSSIAPGIFLIGYNIGTGSVTTAASTGAEYGMTLVWPLLLSCLFTFVLIVAFGRYTAITGDTAPDRIQEAERSGHRILHKPVTPDALRLLLVEILG